MNLKTLYCQTMHPVYLYLQIEMLYEEYDHAEARSRREKPQQADQGTIKYQSRRRP